MLPLRGTTSALGTALLLARCGSVVGGREVVSVREDVPVRLRRRWGWSWRAPLGWWLLGWVLLAVCVALPVWALTAGDPHEAARWAPLMALPLTALGLALALSDRGCGGPPDLDIDAHCCCTSRWQKRRDQGAEPHRCCRRDSPLCEARARECRSSRIPTLWQRLAALLLVVHCSSGRRRARRGSFCLKPIARDHPAVPSAVPLCGGPYRVVDHDQLRVRTLRVDELKLPVGRPDGRTSFSCRGAAGTRPAAVCRRGRARRPSTSVELPIVPGAGGCWPTRVAPQAHSRRRPWAARPFGSRRGSPEPEISAKSP